MVIIQFSITKTFFIDKYSSQELNTSVKKSKPTTMSKQYKPIQYHLKKRHHYVLACRSLKLYISINKSSYNIQITINHLDMDRKASTLIQIAD